VAIFRDAKSTTTEGVADTTLVADLPVYQETDWLLSILCTGAATVSSASSGWGTPILNQQAATASEAAPSITISPALTMAVTILSFPDGDPTDIIDDIQYTNEGAGTTSHTIPTATSTVAGALDQPHPDSCTGLSVDVRGLLHTAACTRRIFQVHVVNEYENVV
jgi:hypothetical protein